MNGNVRLQPFTCYFCNKLVENETNEGHRTTCGAVLEPCPNKCGSYIQRKMRSKHLLDCTNKKSETLPRLTKQKRFDQSDLPMHINSYNSVASSIMSPSTSPGIYSPDLNQTFRNIYGDVSRISSKLILLEAQLAQLHKNHELIKSRQEKMQSFQTSNSQVTTQVENLLYQNEHILEWRKSIDSELNNLRYEISQYGRNKSEFERRTLALEDKLMSFQNVTGDISGLKEIFVKEQLTSKEFRNDLKAQIQKVEDFHTQENATICGLWADHRRQLEEFQDQMSTANKALEEQKLKQSSIVFDLRAITQISTENAEKLEIQERDMVEIRKMITQLKLDMEMLEDSQTSSYFTKPGHLIWKMTDFKIKMDSAKSNNAILRSPIFYTHEYGYKIRLIVYLNGIKKWKGRHMIACLHVLKGEYDLMLPWPCHIEGSITIRDLYEFSDPRHTIKFISAKRQCGDEANEDPQESSTQYIFIPHTTLTKYNHVREDTLFLEIKISKTQKYQDETSL